MVVRAENILSQTHLPGASGSFMLLPVLLRNLGQASP